MWSWWLNKIKSSNLSKSIANSNSLAEEQVDQTLANTQLENHYAYSFTKMGRWQYLIELFIGSVVLALVLVLAEAQTWENVKSIQFFQYLLFIDWVLLLFITLQDYFQHYFIKMSLSRSFTVSFILLQLIVLVTTVCLNFLIFFGGSLNLIGLTSSILLDSVIKNLSFGILLGAFSFRYLYVREQWVRQKHSELQARIYALQARIHPHFLFNSLNNVMSLISIDPEKAEHLLLNLSRIFRASLQELKLVSLQDEIDLCKKYLEIEQIRLGDRLNVEWKFEHVVKFSEVKIPLLTLQPLLENSIFHGVEKNIAKSTVSILVEILYNKVNIVITNPCIPEKTINRQHHGIAIKNVKQRLEAYYGQSVIFRVHQGAEIYTTVIQYNYK